MWKDSSAWLLAIATGRSGNQEGSGTRPLVVGSKTKESAKTDWPNRIDATTMSGLKRGHTPEVNSGWPIRHARAFLVPKGACLRGPEMLIATTNSINLQGC